MEKEKLTDWNTLLFFVSDIYGATRRIKFSSQSDLGNRIRKTAVSLAASLNPGEEKATNPDFQTIYPILSSISVLETYLHLAKKHKLLKDTRALEEKLEEVKNALYRLLGQK